MIDSAFADFVPGHILPGVAQFGSAAGTVTEGNDLRLPVRVDTTVAVPNGATTDKTCYTTTDRFRLEDVLLVVDTALVGAGSCVASVGATAGGQEYLLNITLNSSTALGVVAGESLLSLGASMAAANGFQALLASGANIVLRLVTTGVITAGAVRLIVRGTPNV